MIKAIENNVLSAWYLLVGKQDALKWMTFSPTAMRQSWVALLLAVPFLGLDALATKISGPAIAQAASIKNYVETSAPMSLVIAVVAWIVGILVQRTMAILLGRKDKADAMVIINNWLRLLVNFVGAPLSVLVALHWLNPVIALSIGFCISVYMIALITWISSIVLDLSLWRASAITLSVMASEFVVINVVLILSGAAKL